jgi:hypothetical protein
LRREFAHFLRFGVAQLGPWTPLIHELRHLFANGFLWYDVTANRASKHTA